jgi:hypothetical protein
MNNELTPHERRVLALLPLGKLVHDPRISKTTDEIIISIPSLFTISKQFRRGVSRRVWLSLEKKQYVRLFGEHANIGYIEAVIKIKDDPSMVDVKFDSVNEYNISFVL